MIDRRFIEAKKTEYCQQQGKHPEILDQRAVSFRYRYAGNHDVN
jgi:hypothetical protein